MNDMEGYGKTGVLAAVVIVAGIGVVWYLASKGISADPRYMQGNREIPEYTGSTNDYGGAFEYYSGPVGQRAGIPRTDVERAMNHYNITESQYLTHPGWYPLPQRGTGGGSAKLV